MSYGPTRDSPVSDGRRGFVPHDFSSSLSCYNTVQFLEKITIMLFTLVDEIMINLTISATKF